MCLIPSNDILTKADYREELMRSIESSHKRLLKAVQEFNAPKALNPINRESLDDFPFMVWVKLNDYVKVRKRANRFDNLLCFDTFMLKDGEFGEHFHEDTIESTEVVYGELLDTSDGRVYKDGEIAHYEKGVKHTPIATKDTMLHVLFKP